MLLLLLFLPVQPKIFHFLLHLFEILHIFPAGIFPIHHFLILCHSKDVLSVEATEEEKALRDAIRETELVNDDNDDYGLKGIAIEISEGEEWNNYPITQTPTNEEESSEEEQEKINAEAQYQQEKYEKLSEPSIIDYENIKASPEITYTSEEEESQQEQQEESVEEEEPEQEVEEEEESGEDESNESEEEDSSDSESEE